MLGEGQGWGAEGSSVGCVPCPALPRQASTVLDHGHLVLPRCPLGLRSWAALGARESDV